jgi:2Fe-2S ferredoxin
MPVIKILPHPEYCPSGTQVEAPSGTSICEALLDNGIEIEHACDMSCACTTCHVIVRAGYDSLEAPSDKEDDLLDKAWGLELTSRLSCQAKVADEPLEIEVPKYTINQVSEGKSG